MEDGLLLQLEPLSHYDDILSLQKDSKLFRPTLFDFLNHNALAFYTTNETSITKPAYKFEIDNPEFLCDAFTFSNLELQSKDSTSLQLKALKIFQDLIQFHIKDKEPFALVDVDLERLNYVNQNAVFNNKESLLLETLKEEAEKLKSHEVSGLYHFKIASIYYQQGNQYQPKTDDTYRWKTKDAFELCNEVISKFPNSKGAEKCTFLKQQIEINRYKLQLRIFCPFSNMHVY